MRDIARVTRMSLAGLYYYFTTKEELLYLIQERCFVTLLQRWEQVANSDMDARARILELVPSDERTRLWKRDDRLKRRRHRLG